MKYWIRKSIDPGLHRIGRNRQPQHGDASMTELHIKTQ
jgi:hypothetical protein